MPTSTPVQFEPDVLRASVQRLLARQPDCMYLTHYGRVGGVPRLGALFLSLLEETVQRARALASRPDRRRALMSMLADLYADSLKSEESSLDKEEVTALLALDIDLNAQGIEIWLDRQG